MSVVLHEDCVKRADGTYVCWDDSCQSYRIISTKKVPASALTTDELSGLVKLMAKKNRGGTPPIMTQEEVDVLINGLPED